MLHKSNISETLALFLSNPSKSFYLMEVSRRIGLAHTSVKRDLLRFRKEGLLIGSIEKKGSRRFPTYRVNPESREVRKLRKILNYKNMLESGLAEYIANRLMPRCVVLFGSFRRGEDTEESDIDLFVECPREEISLESFEKRLGRKIELHFSKRFKDYPKELKNNIVNGIVLYGFLEAYP